MFRIPKITQALKVTALIMISLGLLSCPPPDELGSAEVINNDGITATPISPAQDPSETFSHPYFGQIREIAPDLTYSQDNVQNWHRDAVFYHVWINAFRDSGVDGIGDINGVTEALTDGYFTDLGVTALWLSPFFDNNSPAGNRHGYDTVNHYEIEGVFGTKADLRNLLSEAHGLGIKVIFDFVPNHVSDRHPWFLNSQLKSNGYGDWFRWSKVQPDGWTGWDEWSDWHWNESREEYFYSVFPSSIPDLNYRNPEVKKAMADVLIYWLNFGFDGIRVDAVKYIYEDEPTEISGEFWENDPDTLHFFTEVRDILDRYGEAPHGKHKMMVAENWETNPSKIKAYGRHEGEPAFHSTLDFYSAYNMRNAVISANPNYVTGISGTTGFYNYASTFNTIPDIDLAPFLSNHDNVVDRPATYSNSTAKSRLAASLLLFSPGSPYLYYGNEIAMTGAAGDDRELRTPMDWGEVASQSLDDSSVLSWYQALGKARGEYATVFSNPGKIRETFTGSGWSAVLWQDGATELLAVFNLEGSTKSVTLDLSSYSLSASAVSNVIGSSDGNFSNLASFQVNDIPLYGTRLLNLNDGGAQNYALDNTTDVSTYVPPNHPNLYIRGDSIPGATWGNGLSMNSAGSYAWTRDVNLNPGTYSFKFHSLISGWDAGTQYGYGNLQYGGPSSIGVDYRTSGANGDIYITINSSGTYRFHVDVSEPQHKFWITGL